MCCFSGEVDDVSNTKIFARFIEDQLQGIAYQMDYAAKAEVAMILPVPLRGSQGDKIEFINLEKYADFFLDMHKGFPRLRAKGRGGFGGSGGPDAVEEKIVVEEVGSFEASFVPTIKDFDRLDERFRLPAGTWEKLPGYGDYSFAVFQLKPDAHSVHPMAFTFPTRKRAPLFFPTVHIHDGSVHDWAGFDHTLYLQPRDFEQMLPDGWTESAQPARAFMKMRKDQGLLEGNLHCYRRKLQGQLKNADTLVA